MVFGGKVGALLVLVFVSYVTAFSIPSIRSGEGDAVVKVPLTVNRTTAYEFNLTIHGLVDYYRIDIEVGSSKQVVPVIVDTGSSDLVFNTDTYVPSSSSTSKHLNSSIHDWGTTYDVYSDTVSLGELILKNFTLGVGGEGLNILGIGAKSTEQVTSHNQYHENFPLALRDSGYIKSAAFSLYLETFSSSVVQSGSILFGGIDHAKYTGELVAHPYSIGDPDVTLSVKGIKFADGLFHPIDDPVVIDTGTVGCAFPDAYIAEIKSVFGPTYDNGTIINYQESWKSTYFSVDFGNQVITIPYFDFLVPDGAGGYLLTYIYSSESDIRRNVSVLGDTFIRNAYTVYNYDDHTILFAQINHNANGASNISVI